MNSRITIATLALGVYAMCVQVACTWNTDDTVASDTVSPKSPLPVREGTVLIDGCALDAWQDASLAQPGMKRLVQNVVFLCLVPRPDGQVTPTDPDARQRLQTLATAIRDRGYSPRFALTFTDGTGAYYDGAQAGAWLADASLRAAWLKEIATFLPAIDGIELDMQRLPNDSLLSVSAWVDELATAIHPQKKLAVYLPPSSESPSDTPGGRAFAVHYLSERADSLRLMTLDYSGRTPGPTTDSTWIKTVYELALSQQLADANPKKFSFAIPLYGADFGPHGIRGVSYTEALGLSLTRGASRPQRLVGGPLSFSYQSTDGEPHQVWTDDAQSLSFLLSAMTYTVIPKDVGIFYYGLGGDDPALFRTLGERTP